MDKRVLANAVGRLILLEHPIVERHPHDVEAEVFDQFKIARRDVVRAVSVDQPLAAFVAEARLECVDDSDLVFGLDDVAEHPRLDHQPVPKVAPFEHNRLPGLLIDQACPVSAKEAQSRRSRREQGEDEHHECGGHDAHANYFSRLSPVG